MQWTERQRAMLLQIGVRVWVAPAVARVAGPARERGETDVEGDGVAVAPDARLPRHAVESPPPPTPAIPPMPAPGYGPGSPTADAGSRAERIASMDWTALRESAAACTACALHRGRTHSVFASAPGQADWLVIGDPPSADDDRDGVPISGDAGRLLDNMLIAARLSRASTALGPTKACVTTIVKCRPPQDRAADASEIAACAPYLKRQIELVRPKVLFAMGRCAAQALVDSVEPVGKLRGTVHRAHGLPVVATFHPAHLARHASDKAKAFEDLCRAVEVVDQAA